MGLYDRNYMRGKNPLHDLDGMNMVWLLIGVNAALFMLEFSKPLLSGENFRYYQIVTSIFSHANFGHVFFNMFGMFIFGSLIARKVGFWKFLWLFLLSGICGNLIFMAFFHGNYALLGASGGLYGVMMAAAMLEPDQRFVMIFLPFFSLKTKTLVVAYTVIELVSQANGVSSTAHLAHLGGFLGGYLFVKFFLKNMIRWDIFNWKTFGNKSRGSTGNWRVVRPEPIKSSPVTGTGAVTQRELDALLDKVSRNGINSLSEAELARLRRAREQMQGKG